MGQFLAKFLNYTGSLTLSDIAKGLVYIGVFAIAAFAGITVDTGYRRYINMEQSHKKDVADLTARIELLQKNDTAYKAAISTLNADLAHQKELAAKNEKAIADLTAFRQSREVSLKATITRLENAYKKPTPDGRIENWTPKGVPNPNPITIINGDGTALPPIPPVK